MAKLSSIKLKLLTKPLNGNFAKLLVICSGGAKLEMMKETLRKRIERELEEIIDRYNQLDKNIGEYVGAGNLTDAAINQIKRDTLSMVVSRLKDALK